MDNIKICTKCKKSFPISRDYFYYSSSHKYGLHNICIECMKEIAKKNHKKRKLKEKIREKNFDVKYYDNNYTKKYFREHRLKKYNGKFSIKDHKQMYEKQDGKCAICGNVDYRDGKFGTLKLNVDHCHKTKQVRELLCTRCNLLLGYTKDNTLILAKALKYLQKHKKR